MLLLGLLFSLLLFPEPNLAEEIVPNALPDLKAAQSVALRFEGSIRAARGKPLGMGLKALVSNLMSARVEDVHAAVLLSRSRETLQAALQEAELDLRGKRWHYAEGAYVEGGEGNWRELSWKGKARAGTPTEWSYGTNTAPIIEGPGQSMGAYDSKVTLKTAVGSKRRRSQGLVVVWEGPLPLPSKGEVDLFDQRPCVLPRNLRPGVYYLGVRLSHPDASGIRLVPRVWDTKRIIVMATTRPESR
jgi:hypothetical protein